MHTETHRRPPPEWTERCETLNLLALEGEYASFIADIENEIATLEHIRACETCRTSITETTAGTRAPNENTWIRLLKERGDDGPDEPVDDRIRQRIEKLREIRADAELELNDLRERLRERSDHADKIVQEPGGKKG